MADSIKNTLSIETHRESKKTKWIIFTKALELFALHGVEAVPMRDISDAAGIATGSIYSHYPSKEDLVDEMYDYYEEKTVVVDDYLEKLSRLSQTDTPREFLNRCVVGFPDADNMYVTYILHIAMNRMRTDKRARRIIEKRFGTDLDLMRTVLSKMRDEGKIKPVDVDAYVNIYQYMCFSASYNLDTGLAFSFQQWEDMNNLLFSFILKDDDPDAQ